MKHGERKQQQVVMVKANGYNPGYEYRVGKIVENVTEFVVKVELVDTKEILKLYKSDLIHMKMLDSIAKGDFFNYYRAEMNAEYGTLRLKEVNYIERKDGSIGIYNVIKDKATRYRKTIKGYTVIKGKRIYLCDFKEYHKVNF